MRRSAQAPVLPRCLNTGGGVAQTIVDSPAFGPAINNALTAQGLIPGTTLYNQFLRDAQTAVDAGDPINYIATLLAAKPVHITQVVGSTGWLPDQVVPNSSTQRMITAGGSAIRRLGTSGRYRRRQRRVREFPVRPSRLDHRSVVLQSPGRTRSLQSACGHDGNAADRWSCSRPAMAPA